MMHQEICNVLRSVFSLDTTVHAATRSCKILPIGQNNTENIRATIRATMLRLLSPPRRVFRLQKVSCFYFSKNKVLLRV